MVGLPMPRTRPFGRGHSEKIRIPAGMCTPRINRTVDIKVGTFQYGARTSRRFRCAQFPCRGTVHAGNSAAREVEGWFDYPSCLLLSDLVVQELKRRLQALTATHTDTTLSRLHRALSQHTQLSQRILRLVQHLHLLIPAVRSSSIRPEEEALRVTLEEMEEDLRKPGGMSKMKSKLNELWALVGAINAARERGKKAGNDGAVEWTVVDDEGLKQITQVWRLALGVQEITDY